MVEKQETLDAPMGSIPSSFRHVVMPAQPPFRHAVMLTIHGEETKALM
jgi:hypothetical protein